MKSLASKGLGALPPNLLSKIVFLPADLSKQLLGLAPEVQEELRNILTVVLHSLWTVNFNPGVNNFESQYIRGIYNIINLSLNSNTVDPASFLLYSSTLAAVGTPVPAHIHEIHVADIHYA